MRHREDVIAFDDGFAGGFGGNETRLVRYPDKAKRNFLATFDDVFPDDLRQNICASAGSKPWGVYVPFASLSDADADDKLGLARSAVRAIFKGCAAGTLGGDSLMAEAHGVAVWCLSSVEGSTVEYHIDYAELHRYETGEIVPPLYAATYHAADVDMRGGDFWVNVDGLDHYRRKGYKAPVDLEEPGWIKVPYRRNRVIVHDGEFPHLSDRVRSLEPVGARRIILGFNVFSSRVRAANERAPEHSPQFNATVKLYQAARLQQQEQRRGRLETSVSVDDVKADKRFARFFVGLARCYVDRAAKPVDKATIVPGARVLARWRTGVRLWPATVADARGDVLDLRFDDGCRWTNAPASAVLRSSAP